MRSGILKMFVFCKKSKQMLDKTSKNKLKFIVAGKLAPSPSIKFLLLLLMSMYQKCQDCEVILILILINDI